MHGTAFEEVIRDNFTDHEESVMWARAIAGAARDVIKSEDLDSYSA